MTRRRRVRGFREQAYWDALSPSERVAFTIGYHVASTGAFPPEQHVSALRRQCDEAAKAKRAARPKPLRLPKMVTKVCTTCGHEFAQVLRQGRPFSKCVPCRRVEAGWEP